MQQELLKLYALDVAEEDLLQIKRLIAHYFMEKALDGADRVWDEKGYSKEIMDQWLAEDKKSYGNKDSD